MHVCIVTPYPQSNQLVVGGVEAASLRLAQGLLARGDTKVTIVAPGDTSRVEQRGDIEIHWTATPLRRLPGILTYWTTERRALQAAVRRVGADVVHVQAIAGWGLGMKGPRVLQMHGVPEDAVLMTGRKSRHLSRLVHLAVEPRARRAFPAVAVVSANMAERFKSQFTGRSLLAENTVPDDFFDTPRTPVPGRVLFGGIVSYRKNTLGVIEALHGVLQDVPQATLHIAGDVTSYPAYVESCTSFVATHDMTEHVRFLGGISIEQMRHELAEARVVVLPSFSESAPIIICEALAAGVPVITSRRDGMVFMIDEGVTGFLIEPDDTEALRKRIVELLTNDERNQTMGEAGKLVARQRFTQAALATTMTECYAELV